MKELKSLNEIMSVKYNSLQVIWPTHTSQIPVVGWNGVVVVVLVTVTVPVVGVTTVEIFVDVIDVGDV